MKFHQRLGWHHVLDGLRINERWARSKLSNKGDGALFPERAPELWKDLTEAIKA